MSRGNMAKPKTLSLNAAIDLLLKLHPLLEALGKLKHQLNQQGIKMEVKVNLTYGVVTLKFKEVCGNE